MIYTDRLMIELLSNEDMETIVLNEKDEDLIKAYSEMLLGSRTHPEQREWYAIWDIRLKDNVNKISVGNMSFKGITDDGMIEIGYGIIPEYEGFGYATEAVLAIIKWAATQKEVKRIEAETEADNYASQRVLEKSGFMQTGTTGQEGPRFFWPLSQFD